MQMAIINTVNGNTYKHTNSDKYARALISSL